MREPFIQRSEYCLNSVATSAEVARYARRHDIPAARYVSHDMFRVAERYSIEKFPPAEIYRFITFAFCEHIVSAGYIVFIYHIREANISCLPAKYPFLLNLSQKTYCFIPFCLNYPKKHIIYPRFRFGAKNMIKYICKSENH